jgi:hypothetical protein
MIFDSNANYGDVINQVAYNSSIYSSAGFTISQCINRPTYNRK